MKSMIIDLEMVYENLWQRSVVLLVVLQFFTLWCGSVHPKMLMPIWGYAYIVISSYADDNFSFSETQFPLKTAVILIIDFLGLNYRKNWFFENTWKTRLLLLVVNCRATWCTSQLKLKKIKKKVRPEKISYLLGKWNFLTPILKNVLYFFKRKLFLYFGKRKPRKISNISGNGTFLYFSKPKPPPQKNFLYFRKGILRTLT